MLLYLFVIMLVNLDEAARQPQFNKQWWLALACVLVVGLELFYFIRKGAGAFRLAEPSPQTSTLGNTEQLADVLFSQYLLPFELASVLLLVAIVGSVLMGKKEV
jgi:NADH-quinone oxidoreductase subunit J